MTKQKNTHKKKRHAGHHKQKTKKYKSAYWPYLPLLLIIAGFFLFVLAKSPVGTNVLAFATEMSSASLLEETNRHRQANEMEPLQLNQKLSAAAQAKAEDMAKRNYWSHETPDGNQPWTFIEDANYQYIKAGENLAYGFLTSAQTVNGWMNSDSHRDNMLDPVFSEVGFGFVNAKGFQNSNEETIVVAMYAQPLQQTIDSANESFNEDHADTGETIIAMEVPANNQEVRSITRIQSVIGGQFAWMTFSLGIVSGAAASGLFVTHGIRLRRLIRKSEDFIVHHPLLDITLISLLLLAAFLADHVGYIL